MATPRDLPYPTLCLSLLVRKATLQRKSHLCIPFLLSWELRGLIPNYRIYVSVSDLYVTGSVHIFPAAWIDRLITDT